MVLSGTWNAQWLWWEWGAGDKQQRGQGCGQGTPSEWARAKQIKLHETVRRQGQCIVNAMFK